MSPSIKETNIHEFLDTINQKSNEEYFGYAEKRENIEFLQLLDFLQKSDEKFVYWSEPYYNYKFAAFSPIGESREPESERYEYLNQYYNHHCCNYFTNFNNDLKSLAPLLVGGIKFFENEISEEWSDFKSTDFFMPRFLFIEVNGQKFFIINFKKAEANNEFLENLKNDLFSKIENPSASLNGNSLHLTPKNGNTDNLESWSEKINEILKNLRCGKASKVVLSRSLLFEISDVPRFSNIMANLEARYPMCYNFIFRSGESFFFGASPEQLFKLRDGLVESDALAGSAPIGKTPEENEKILHDELFNWKNRAEHASVVGFLKNSLDLYTENLILEEKPEVKKLENIQHLWTPVKAKIKKGSSIISILQSLHPTPAVCGLPVESAKEIISKLENHQRGLFAGALGWLNAKGEGEFTVAIRSALLKKNVIHLYAGSGIVEGSEALSEFNETNLKFKPILKLFKETYEN